SHDLALVIGAPVFRYHQWQPGQYLPETTELIQIGEDTAAAARAPFGDALIADPVQTLLALAETLDAADPAADPGPARGAAAAAPAPSGDALIADPVQTLLALAKPLDVADPAADPGPARAIAAAATSATDGVLHPEEVFAGLRETMPAETRYVVESTSTNAAFWAQMDLELPGSYFFPASGGLGWGLPASMGVALADPIRPVVAIIGDGSAHYSISALRTAVEENIGVIIVLLRNGT